MKYPLATSTWGDEEIQAVTKVVQSGLCTMGENVAAFEREFASFVGSKYAVMVNSGSSANLIMVGALFFTQKNQLKPGDEVIVPAVSWPTTYYPLAQYGLRLKFVDIDRETLNYDLDALKGAITDRTKLIMVVNLLGNPNDFAALRKMVSGKSIQIIEDNCESLGALFEGQQAGTFGRMGSYSTFFSHHMSTMEGGVVVTDDEELYHILLCLRAHGWTRNLPRENQVSGVKSDDPFEESFKFVLPGYNVRPLEVEGAIGIIQLKKLPGFLEHRRNNSKIFQDLFGNDARFTLQKEVGSSSWFGFSLTINDGYGLTRKEVASALTSAGIECRPIVAGNFAKNKVMSYFDHEIHGRLTNAERIDSLGLFVGNHQYAIRGELEHMKSALAGL